MSSPEIAQLIAHLEAIGDGERANHSSSYFKSGEGEYGAGDRFRGIRVPALRQLVKQYRGLSHRDLLALLQSPWHEDRLLALLIWVEQYRRGDSARRQLIYDDYLAHTTSINNWDLIDSSAEHIVGAQLFAKGEFKGPSELLTRLAQSTSLWERRISIMSTFYFIRQHEFAETLRVADLLLHDHHDLIHKAVGWMLREIGERDLAVEEAFLLPRYRSMPRTMLRYAIEKFPEERRQAYLRGTISESEQPT